MTKALETISSSRIYNAESSATALCLLRALNDFELIVSLSVSRQLMLHFKHVTVALQGVDIDIVTGYKMMTTVKKYTSECKFHWITIMNATM